MAEMPVKEKLFAVLERDFNINLNGIDPDQSIFDQIPVDSMLLVGIVAGIEQEFGIELPLSFMEKPTLTNLIQMISGSFVSG